jgi:catecholate siderophore receptor
MSTLMNPDKIHRHSSNLPDMQRITPLLALSLLTATSLQVSAQGTRDSARVKQDTTKRTTALDPVRIVGRGTSPGRGYALGAGVSATKTTTALRDIPQSVTVVMRDLIADQSMQSLADVVRYVPGITMAQGEGNRDQPTIRGNNTSGDLFVDGVRDDVQYFRDLYNIDRVEALTGANAMLFGRGNGGGILNRVTKQPSWSAARELTLQAGSYDDRRVAADVGQGVTGVLAARVNGMYEKSGLYRDDFEFKRWGVNPRVTLSPESRRSALTLSYEHFNDRRTADRGIPSLNGLPYNSDVSTFFGDPNTSYANATVDAGELTASHVTSSGLAIANHTRLASYDKIYQNVFPGAIDAAATRVAITAYNNATRRHNLFNQTDLTYRVSTGTVSHTLLAGVELGRQVSNNFRNTGFFNNAATTFSAPVTDPTIAVPVTFRQSASDADNHVETTANSVYAQDQIALKWRVQLVAGFRAQRVDMNYHNNRGDTTRSRRDDLFMPRAGLIVKPVEQLSLYTSYGVSYLPSSGDQFSSLTNITETLKPERFTNMEVGAKWQAFERIALTAAVYRLDRTNTRAPDPVNPALVVQTGKTRSTGTELSVFGTVTSIWQMAGTYTNQAAKIVTQTAAASPGATVAIVPHTIASLWNKVQVAPRVGFGLGASRRSDMYAAIDNRVTLRGYTRVDAAAFVSLTSRIRAQMNVDNVADEKFYLTADNNNNITPGTPRAVRVSVATAF